jgi:mannose-6-phosphate isomerase-like protein (cupin superfamily)
MNSLSSGSLWTPTHSLSKIDKGIGTMDEASSAGSVDKRYVPAGHDVTCGAATILENSEPPPGRKVCRPWGSYESVDSGERFQVKRILVNPGAALSLQMHHHRAEHWIVVRGTAEVTCGEKTFLLAENQSTYIPLGMTHRLSNPGKLPLEIIEVQSGGYLGEDDIVRFDDRYGRTAG